MSIRRKFLSVVVGLGAATSAIVGSLTYRSTVTRAAQEARASGQAPTARTVETFMVSTRRFDGDFSAAATPAEKQNVLDDWNRTIRAVDTAVIHDFGEDQSRVRLIGDQELVGYKPLGGDATRVNSRFEADAIAALKNGSASFAQEDGGVLRRSAPLWSDAHRGCGSCHIAVIEGLQADLGKRVLLGTLNGLTACPTELPLRATRR